MSEKINVTSVPLVTMYKLRIEELDNSICPPSSTGLREVFILLKG
jgi:hypothetical protein